MPTTPSCHSWLPLQPLLAVTRATPGCHSCQSKLPLHAATPCCHSCLTCSIWGSRDENLFSTRWYTIGHCSSRTEAWDICWLMCLCARFFVHTTPLTTLVCAFVDPATCDIHVYVIRVLHGRLTAWFIITDHYINTINVCFTRHRCHNLSNNRKPKQQQNYDKNTSMKLVAKFTKENT